MNRTYKQARAFVLQLQLTSVAQWILYSQGKLPGHDPKPSDIPARPDKFYSESGWKGYGDWLGTTRGKVRSFTCARAFVRQLRLTSKTQWHLYCQGKLPEYETKPADIPSNPDRTYRELGWMSYNDWLGTNTIATYKRTYRPFAQARTFVQSLQLKSLIQWKLYCQGKLPEYESKPVDIPAAPQSVYQETGWKGYNDWLGNSYSSFNEARAFVRQLKLPSARQWKLYCQGKLPGYQSKPENIPASPETVYGETNWLGMGDWLGTYKIGTTKRQFRSFTQARIFVQQLQLTSVAEWKAYCEGKFARYEAKPLDIPRNPNIIYRETGWKGYRDWLGTK